MGCSPFIMQIHIHSYVYVYLYLFYCTLLTCLVQLYLEDLLIQQAEFKNIFLFFVNHTRRHMTVTTVALRGIISSYKQEKKGFAT